MRMRSFQRSSTQRSGPNGTKNGGPPKEAAVSFGLPAKSDGLISYGTVTMTSSMYQPEDT